MQTLSHTELVCTDDYSNGHLHTKDRLIKNSGSSTKIQVGDTSLTALYHETDQHFATRRLSSSIYFGYTQRAVDLLKRIILYNPAFVQQPRTNIESFYNRSEESEASLFHNLPIMAESIDK